ncbi:hypothetical protein Lal_00021173 [Lupinus albus]|nr:hypothetical protein Lal_00021173 [Lupinus albus]
MASAYAFHLSLHQPFFSSPRACEMSKKLLAAFIINWEMKIRSPARGGIRVYVVFNIISSLECLIHYNLSWTIKNILTREFIREWVAVEDRSQKITEEMDVGNSYANKIGATADLAESTLQRICKH